MKFIVLLFIAQLVFADPIPEQNQLNGQTFATGINDFSVEFTKKLGYENENIIYSPFGLAMASGMLLKGAQGETKDSLFRMLNMLQYSNKDDIHKLFKELLGEYKGMSARDKNPRNATVELSNLAVTAEEYNLPDSYTNALKEYYEALVGKENFATNGVAVKEKLNKFVSERTHGLIPETFKEPLDPSTVLVLLNTIFFKGFWLNKFDSRSVSNETFYNNDKSESKVEMMALPWVSLKHAHSDKLKASVVNLPYNGDFSMIVVLPDEKYGLKDLIKNMKNDELEDVVKSMSYKSINLHFPKFSYEHKIDLLTAFPKMNVNIVPVLTPLDPKLVVSSAFHKAKIQVHESGTEAAGVTVIVFNTTFSLNPSQPLTLKCDHSFMFFIRDTNSNVNLFVGVVSKL